MLPMSTTAWIAVLLCALCACHSARGAAPSRSAASLAATAGTMRECMTDLLMSYYSDRADRLFAERGGETLWWGSGYALDTLMRSAIQHKQTRPGPFPYEWVPVSIFERAFEHTPWEPHSYEHHFFSVTSIDDSLWWGIALIRTFEHTRNETYLSTAKYVWEQVRWHAWDDTFGGGVWWTNVHESGPGCEGTSAYKNAITNELFLYMSIRLAVVVSKTDRSFDVSRYVRFANLTADWLVNTSGLLNSESLINDGLDCVTGKNNNGTTWTYNQGVILGGLSLLATATNQKSYMVVAEEIALASLTHLTDSDGILTEACVNMSSPTPSDCMNTSNDRLFKGAFASYLADLVQLSDNEAFKTQAEEFIASNYLFMLRDDVNSAPIAACLNSSAIAATGTGLDGIVWMGSLEEISSDAYTAIVSALQLTMTALVPT